MADWGGYRGKLNPRGVNLSDVWTDLSPVRHARTKQRPFGINELNQVIPERAILLTTNPGDIVLDPFGGGGSTYRMAEKHDRLWIGSEIGDCTAITDGLRKMTEVILGSKAPPASLLKVFRSPLRHQLEEALRAEGWP
ncbi:MAG: hypothetical protein H5T92_00430 [Synergistales bacterium]|nr:hypothetical protein [Synergistales bacterium]